MPLTLRSTSDAAFSLCAVLLVLLQMAREWGDAVWAEDTQIVVALAIALCLAQQAQRAGKLFLLVAAGLTLMLAVQEPGWRDPVRQALLSAAFFVAFFFSVSLLREAAISSPAMEAAGNYLTRQPPGRRYLALTLGAHLFAQVLNFGALQLLGTLAVSTAGNDRDETIRRIRLRRMLLAIQRGFVAMIPWSPMSFAVVIAVATIPGTSWAQLALPGLVTAALMIGIGWAVDTLFKPKPRPGQRAARTDPGRWTALLPLALLLGLMLCMLLGGEALFGLRAAGVILTVVPGFATLWLFAQTGSLPRLSRRLRNFLAEELPGYRHEALLIMAAGYIGGVASAVMAPHLEAAHLDLTALPTWTLLLALILIMPVLGQLGANSVLSMSLIAPLLPPAGLLGISPTALGVALICGWVIAALTTPFTATTLLIARFGGIPALSVGWVWNRVYVVVLSFVLIVWTMLYAFVLS